jgi:hypothetical protein
MLSENHGVACYVIRVSTFSRDASDVCRGAGGAAADGGAPPRLPEPAPAASERSSDAAQEELKGPSEGRAAVYPQRAFPGAADRCAALHALPRVWGTILPSWHV